MTGNYIIAHDVGTSGNKAVLASLDGKVLYDAHQAYGVMVPEPLAAEQNPDVLYQAVVSTTSELIEKSGVDPRDIAGLGISTQAFNLLPINREGRPAMNMISWMDLRATEQAENIRKGTTQSELYQLTYNFPRAKDVVPKILWLKEKRPDVWKNTSLLANCKEYILHQITGEFYMDQHSASIFFLLDPYSRQWSTDACDLLGIPVDMLPEVRPGTDRIGSIKPDVAREMNLLPGTPVILSPADIAAAQIGCGAGQAHHASLSLGTGGWVCVSSPCLRNDPEHPFWALTHISPEMWIIGGGLDTGGGGMRWLRDAFGEGILDIAREKNISVYQLLSEMAAGVPPGAGNLLFIPWVYGERGHMGVEHYAKGAFIGLDLDHNMARMARAVMEGVAFHLRWMMEGMEEAGLEIKAINMIGGGSTSDVWTQIISNVTGRKLRLVKSPQNVGSVGTALTVALGLGIHSSVDDLNQLVQLDQVIKPQHDAIKELYEGLYDEFRYISKSLMKTYARLNITKRKAKGSYSTPEEKNDKA